MLLVIEKEIQKQMSVVMVLVAEKENPKQFAITLSTVCLSYLNVSHVFRG